eukprot:SAG31_NODE_19552_length_599_cov_0.622000_1_plen_65_part_10
MKLPFGIDSLDRHVRHQVCAHNGEVWVIAGNPPGRDGPNMGGPEFPAAVWVYCPATNEWRAGPDF